MTYQQALTALDALYHRIPRIDCQQLCGHDCGPLGMTPLEFHRLQHATPLSIKGKTKDCRLLRHGRCSAYTARPLVCRLWGVVPALPCPHGCRVEGQLTDGEARQLLLDVAALSEHVFPQQGMRYTHAPEQLIALFEASAQTLTTKRLIFKSLQERLSMPLVEEPHA